MPQSQGPVQISPLPGCGPSLSLPLCRTRKQPLPVAAVGGASSAGPGGRSRGALAGLPGPARRQLPPLPRGRSERASAASAGPTDPGRRGDTPLGARADARSVRTAGGAKGPRLGLPRGSGCPAEGRRGAGRRASRPLLGPPVGHRGRRAVGPPRPPWVFGALGSHPGRRRPRPRRTPGHPTADPRAAGPAPSPGTGHLAGPSRRVCPAPRGSGCARGPGAVCVSPCASTA